MKRLIVALIVLGMMGCKKTTQTKLPDQVSISTATFRNLSVAISSRPKMYGSLVIVDNEKEIFRIEENGGIILRGRIIGHDERVAYVLGKKFMADSNYQIDLSDFKERDVSIHRTKINGEWLWSVSILAELGEGSWDKNLSISLEMAKKDYNDRTRKLCNEGMIP